MSCVTTRNLKLSDKRIANKMRKIVCAFMIILAVASASAQTTYTMPSNGAQTITTCSGTVLDPGGTGNYPNSCDGYLIINPATPGCKVVLEGTYNTESSYDYIDILSGAGTSGTAIASFTGSGTITNPVVSTAASGALTIKFHSDQSVQNSGFVFTEYCLCEFDTTCVGTPYQSYGYDTTFTTTGIHVLTRPGPNGSVVKFGVFARMSILNVLGSTSTKTGVAPCMAMTSAEAKKVNEGTKTASPGFTAQAFRASNSASVPLLQAMQCLTPTYSANAVSISFTFGPIT